MPHLEFTPAPSLDLTPLPDLPSPTTSQSAALTAQAPAPLLGPFLAEPDASLQAPAVVALASLPASSGGWLRSLSSCLFSASIFLSVAMIGAYVAPYLFLHWRTSEAEAEAEVIYQKRRAELRAEAEMADQRLQVLDQRVQLVSLGFREVVRKVKPRVVHVANYRELKPGEAVPLGKRTIFQDPDTERRYVQSGVGSGLLVKPGCLLTNYHVVKNAQRLRLTFASGRTFGVDASVVKADAVSDLAIIVLPEKLPPALAEEVNVTTDFADSDKDVQVGDWALAVGSPLGLSQTVTQGVISAKSRLLSMLDMVELLQTDAAINPGNSGGPLFDQYGRVIGINVAIASDNGASQGIGFAIPSNTARKIFQQLAAEGEVVRGYIGVALMDLPPPKARALGLDDAGAVLVTEVVLDHPARQAGIQAGDIVLRFNNDELARLEPMRHLRQRILETAPGRLINLEILRGDQRLTVAVQVGRRPPQLP